MEASGIGAAVPTGKKRYALLDSIRGAVMISMILYHGAWDLVYLFGVRWDWYRGQWAVLWQQSICWTFILLSGFCWALGKHPLKRGLTVFGAGALVSAVTLLAMPDQRVIFGILSMLGSSMLLMIPVNKLLKKLPAGVGLILSMVLFWGTYRLPEGALGAGAFRLILPEQLYRSAAGIPLGFPPPDFFSTDYFPLFPWFFLFMAGAFLFRLLNREGGLGHCFEAGLRPLSFLGKHSLLVYLVHQPLVYGGLWLCFQLFDGLG